MKTFTLSLSILIIFLFYTAVQATSIVITSPEYNVKKATLIVQVEVLEINFEKGPDGLFAVIQLKVEDQVVGNSPDIIEIRRRFIGPDLQFLETNWLPAYAVGERFIITLLPYDQNYSILGLYNGKFVIENNRIQNTNITVDQFKQLIYDIRENFTEMFPEELPRQGQDMESDHSIQKSDIQALNHECGLGVHHLDGEFNTWDFTWDTDFIPAEMHYNPNNAHPNAPGANDIADLAELSYDLWEDDFSFFSFQNAAPFVTNEGQVDNNTSVILWVHDDNVNFLAGAFPFPNTRNDILNCNEDGPGTQTAVDIEFNRNPNVNWHFGVNPPANHQTGTFDFVEVLVHELGHGLGLAHTNNTNSIMLGNPFGGYGNRTGPVRGQTDGDLAARTYQHTVSSLSGTFTHSMVLSASTDQFDVDGTLTIPSSEFVELYPGIEFEVTSNGKLNIENGVQFAFGSNTGIDVYGQVDIDGTSSNPVVMEASGSNNWRGLLFEGSSTQGSVVRHLHVHDADIGVRLQFTGSGNVGFHNLRANGNTTGLHLFANSSLTINNGRFLSSDDDGVWIDDTGTVGFMSSTRASGNNDVGLRIDGGSIASFGGMFQDALAEFKNNTIGLEIDGSSHVGLGELFDDPPPSDPVCWPSKNYSTHTGGCNNILDNSSWDARVRGNSELMAQLTWWGISGPSVSVQSGSSADTNHELHDNAPVPSSVTLPPEPIVKTNEDSGQYLGSSITRIEQDTERDNALAFIRDIREQIADNRNVAWQKLDRARNHTNPVIEKWSQKLSLHLHMLEENYSEATNLGELLLRRADFSEKDRIYTAKHLFYGYLFDTRNPMRAAELLSELEAMDDRAAGRGLLAADFERLSGYAPYPVPAAVELQQEKTKLTVSNYPNPFNPATNIRFTLPATVDVSLRVYDVLGREVGILVNDRLEAGLHNVAFNGSNLSSGVYMYRLRAGEDVLNCSMVLVK